MCQGKPAWQTGFWLLSGLWFLWSLCASLSWGGWSSAFLIPLPWEHWKNAKSLDLLGQSLEEVTRSPSQGPCHFVSFSWHPSPAYVLSRFSHVQLLCNSTDCSSPGSSVHGILQARILEWPAVPSCRGSRDWTHVSYIEPALASRFFTTWEPSTGGTAFLTCYWKQSLKVMYKIPCKSHLLKTRHFWPLSFTRHSLFSFWTFAPLWVVHGSVGGVLHGKGCELGRLHCDRPNSACLPLVAASGMAGAQMQIIIPTT